jgi:hypothetical protein
MDSDATEYPAQIDEVSRILSIFASLGFTSDDEIENESEVMSVILTSIGALISFHQINGSMRKRSTTTFYKAVADLCSKVSEKCNESEDDKTYYHGPELLLASHGTRYACEDDGEQEPQRLRYLLGLNPVAARAKDHNGCTPVHYLFSRALDDASVLGDVMECLIEFDPSVFAVVNNFNDSPLHHMPKLCCDKNIAIVRRVFQVCPEVFKLQNCYGELPLHLP